MIHIICEVGNRDGGFHPISEYIRLMISESEIGNVVLKWLMDEKLELFKKFFGNREVILDNLSSTKHVMSIKIWDKPFSYFTEASTEEKIGFARKIRDYDAEIFEFLQGLPDSKSNISDDEIPEYLYGIPEKAFVDFNKEVTT